MGSGVVRIDPLHFLAGCRKRRLNQALSVLSQPRFLSMYVLRCYLGTLFWGVVLFLCYLCVLSLGCSGYVVSTSASDRLERLVSEITYNVLMGTLNPAHTLICWRFPQTTGVLLVHAIIPGHTPALTCFTVVIHCMIVVLAVFFT